jgi:hypothetical protein
MPVFLLKTAAPANPSTSQVVILSLRRIPKKFRHRDPLAAAAFEQPNIPDLIFWTAQDDTCGVEAAFSLNLAGHSSIASVIADSASLFPTGSLKPQH